MIYTSPIEQVSWAAVEAFCAQGVVESPLLDYKIDFPNDLGRTIAAMANTLGGIIIIGVDEQADGKPVLPIAGVTLQPGLAEKITNIVLDSLTPPVFPEVAVCPDVSGAKAVVVVRIPQSPESPHAIRSNTRVYLRTGNRNKPEDLATLEQVGWLQGRRAKAVDLREHIFGEAIKRSDVGFGFVKRMQGQVIRIVPPTNVVLRVVPHFPGHYFRTPPELAALFRKIRVRDYYRTDHEFPIGTTNASLLQDAAFVHQQLGESESELRQYYTELSVFGQYFFRQTLLAKHSGQSLVRASEIFCRIDEFCASAQKFYAEIGYQGFVLLRASIYGAHALPLGHWDPHGEGTLTRCPDESIGYETAFLIADWDTESRRAMIAALKTIAWAYNWDLSEKLIDGYYARERRR
jgi:hypothetical protein